MKAPPTTIQGNDHKGASSKKQAAKVIHQTKLDGMTGCSTGREVWMAAWESRQLRATEAAAGPPKSLRRHHAVSIRLQEYPLRGAPFPHAELVCQAKV